jgi:hypothetical protein
MAIGSATAASVAVGSEPVTGSDSVGGTSVGTGAWVVAGAQAASTKLIAIITNMNERANLVISIFLLIFYTLASYQAGFKDIRRLG